jgi:REP element-mobilizing transposase RayT
MIMPERKIPLCAGEFYHLHNRGNNRESVFRSRGDYLFFLKRLRDYLVPVMDITAYCLMPTHYHLMVYLRPTSEVLRTSEVGLASRAMMQLAVSHTKGMNWRWKRYGSLFQGAFQSIHVDTDSYLVLSWPNNTSVLELWSINSFCDRVTASSSN